MKFGVKEIIAWITIGISLTIICLWSYWGVNEAFHEGWYSESIWQNLGITFIQYLSVPILITLSCIISLNNKYLGTVIYSILIIFTFFFFNSNSGKYLISIPLVILLLGFYFGEFHNKKFTMILLIIPVISINLFFGIPQLIRVENRINDNNFELRVVEGNGVTLSWAPQGVGFPLKGTNWETANSSCARLDASGNELQESELNIWRLPSREELVKSLTRSNLNSGGTINKQEIAEYKIQPDKETPLWNPNSQVIYYWTSELKDTENAYLVAYNGYILNRARNSGAGYQGYRCVK